MFSLVCNRLKVKIIEVSLAQNEPFISTKGVGPLSQTPPCCTTMFLQQLRTDTDSRDRILHFHVEVLGGSTLQQILEDEVFKVTSLFHRLLLDAIIDNNMVPDGHSRLSNAWGAGWWVLRWLQSPTLPLDVTKSYHCTFKRQTNKKCLK